MFDRIEIFFFIFVIKIIINLFVSCISEFDYMFICLIDYFIIDYFSDSYMV